MLLPSGPPKTTDGVNVDVRARFHLAAIPFHRRVVHSVLWGGVDKWQVQRPTYRSSLIRLYLISSH